MDAMGNQTSSGEVVKGVTDAAKAEKKSTFAGLVIAFDKIMMFLALVLYRVGWWATIFCQQILLGMLTIFGPIQWAFSVLLSGKEPGQSAYPLLNGSFLWSHALFRRLYVLLLFDIVISIQVENLTAITSSQGTINGYVQSAFLTCGYLLAASVVALRCLNLVPDLAAWMIPEGDTAFSTRNFVKA